MLEAVESPLAQVRVVAVRVVLALIDEECAGYTDIDEVFAAVLDGDGRDAGSDIRTMLNCCSLEWVCRTVDSGGTMLSRARRCSRMGSGSGCPG